MFYRIHISQDPHCPDPLERAGWTLLAHPYGLDERVETRLAVVANCGQGRTERELVNLHDIAPCLSVEMQQRVAAHDFFLLEKCENSDDWDLVAAGDALVELQTIWSRHRTREFGLLIPHPLCMYSGRWSDARGLLRLHNLWRRKRVYQRALCACADDGEILASYTNRGLFSLKSDTDRHAVHNWLTTSHVVEPVRLIVVTGSPRADTLHIARAWARGKRRCQVSVFLPATAMRKRSRQRAQHPTALRDRRLPRVQEDLP